MNIFAYTTNLCLKNNICVLFFFCFLNLISLLCEYWHTKHSMIMCRGWNLQQIVIFSYQFIYCFILRRHSVETFNCSTSDVFVSLVALYKYVDRRRKHSTTWRMGDAVQFIHVLCQCHGMLFHFILFYFYIS